MRFTKPSWVRHGDAGKDADPGKRVSIFSVHVHPDGSRIATGGLDGKVRIWSTKPILSEAAELNGRPPKSLCTLNMHTGPVLTVRWAHSGRWLASGSDDTIVMIWDLDPHAKGKVWGSDEVNVEGWKPLKRLPGHESDVTDVAWSPADRYLASVGLDSKVMVWCGFTLERLRSLDQHQGFVKGVCWDPVGEFLATQSDDRSVKIWRTKDWSLEAEVTKPFEDSPGSTFFRRLSWSPDGAHITASNATNNQGFVFIAAVITRGTWNSEISLVGHENTVEVATYNPHIFLRNPEQPIATANICSVVALGADDRSVSIWQTKSARPLIVAKEVFERQIMDLSWSWDGLSLYAASSDGTIAVFSFDPEELEGLSPHSVQEQYLAKFAFVPPPLPEGFSHTRIPGNLSPRSHSQIQSQTQQVNGFGSVNGGEHVHVLTPRKGKKRVGLSSVSAPLKSAGNYNGNNVFHPPAVESASAAPYAGKRKASDMEGIDDRPSSFMRTASNERRFLSPHDTWGPSSSSSTLLQPLPIQAQLTFAKPDGETIIANNDESKNSFILSCVIGKNTVWTDYLPSPAVALCSTREFCATALSDRTLIFHTPNGRRLWLPITLASPVALISARDPYLVVITQAGMAHAWDIQSRQAVFPPVSVAPVLSSSNVRITSMTVSSGGHPIIRCTDGITHTYDEAMMSWVKIAEPWWSHGSEAWPKRLKPGILRGYVDSLESAIDVPHSRPPRADSQDWGLTLTLGHLETKMHASAVLDSAEDFRQALSHYAKRLGQDGLKDKADELIRELYGPQNQRPGSYWPPTVAGLSKRDLLQDVLSQFSHSEHLAQMAKEWSERSQRTSSASASRHSS